MIVKTKMKTSLPLAPVLAWLLGALPVQGALVGGFEKGFTPDRVTVLTPPAGTLLNGGFEQGFDGWGTSGAASLTTALNTFTEAKQGAQLGDQGGVSQDGLVTAGQEYIVTFDARKSDAGPGDLRITLPGVLAPEAVPLTTSFQTFRYTFTPTFDDLSARLEFNWTTQVQGQVAYVDNVNLVPVPEPTTLIAGALLLIPLAVSALRLRRRRTL